MWRECRHIKATGKYKLLNDPEQADLVLELRLLPFSFGTDRAHS
jgi:hypothetical protein